MMCDNCIAAMIAEVERMDALTCSVSRSCTNLAESGLGHQLRHCPAQEALIETSKRSQPQAPLVAFGETRAPLVWVRQEALRSAQLVAWSDESHELRNEVVKGIRRATYRRTGDRSQRNTEAYWQGTLASLFPPFSEQLAFDF
jgi:hypothetical protein